MRLEGCKGMARLDLCDMHISSKLAPKIELQNSGILIYKV